MYKRSLFQYGKRTRLPKALVVLQIPFVLITLLWASATTAQSYLINGLGEYSEFNENTLIVRLELENPAREPIEAIAVDTNKRLSIRILQDKTPRAWSRIWIQNLSINNPPEIIKAQTNDLIAMTQAIKGTLNAGDIVEFERVANDLTILNIDGVEITDFITPGFFEFLLSAFIGPIPPSSELKAALLAGGDINNETNVLFESLGYTDDRPRTLARWGKPAPAPKPAPKPEPVDVAVEEETVTETAVEETAEVAEEAVTEVTEEAVTEVIGDVVAEVAEDITEAVEEAVEEIAAEEEYIEEVAEEDAAILITAESLLAAQNYQRSVLAKVYQNIKYPSAAQRRNREGSLRVAISIGADGNLVNTSIVQNARFASFDDSAIKAIKKAAPFDPLPAGTLEIPMVLEIPVLFKLN